MSIVFLKKYFLGIERAADNQPPSNSVKLIFTAIKFALFIKHFFVQSVIFIKLFMCTIFGKLSIIKNSNFIRKLHCR